MSTEAIGDRAARVLSSYVTCPRCSSPVECRKPDGERYVNGYVHVERISKSRSALAALSTMGLRLVRCRTCDRPILESAKKHGRPSTCCSDECQRQADGLGAVTPGRAFSVFCDTCKAIPGSPCVTKNGKPKLGGVVHLARFKAWVRT